MENVFSTAITELVKNFTERAENVTEITEKLIERAEKLFERAEKLMERADKVMEHADNLTECAENRFQVFSLTRHLVISRDFRQELKKNSENVSSDIGAVPARSGS